MKQTVQLQHPYGTTDSAVRASLWYNRQYSYSTPMTQQTVNTVTAPLWHNRQWVQLLKPMWHTVQWVQLLKHCDTTDSETVRTDSEYSCWTPVTQTVKLQHSCARSQSVPLQHSDVRQHIYNYCFPEIAEMSQLLPPLISQYSYCTLVTQQTMSTILKGRHFSAMGSRDGRLIFFYRALFCILPSRLTALYEWL